MHQAWALAPVPHHVWLAGGCEGQAAGALPLTNHNRLAPLSYDPVGSVILW